MIGSSRPSLSKEDIISRISEADILGYYLGITTIPTLINSPLRKDSNPSFALYSPNGKEVNYIDFSSDERGSCITLLSKLWNLDSLKVLERIQKDLIKFNKVDCNISTINTTKVYSSSNVILESEIREWRDYDIKYWESYGITLSWLKYCDVYPIKHKIIIKDNKRMVFGTDKYAYTFVERKDGKITQKFYQPFNTHGFKWQNNHDKSVIGLWTKLPKKGKLVCICSSVKDALSLMSNMNIPCICLQGEGYNISNKVINELNIRFEKVLVIFDNDKWGIKDSTKLSEITGFTNIILPQFEGGKDISDYYKVKGKKAFIDLFNELLSEYK